MEKRAVQEKASRVLMENDDAPGMKSVAMIVVNLYLLYLAVGAVAWFCSSWMERRGRAVGLSFALVLSSFLINFLAQFWPAARPIAWLSLLQYHQPALAVRENAWPIGNFLVLGAVAFVAWIAG